MLRKYADGGVVDEETEIRNGLARDGFGVGYRRVGATPVVPTTGDPVTDIINSVASKRLGMTPYINAPSHSHAAATPAPSANSIGLSNRTDSPVMPTNVRRLPVQPQRVVETREERARRLYSPSADMGTSMGYADGGNVDDGIDTDGDQGVANMRHGGVVPGPKTDKIDTVPAMLTKNEFVLPVDTVKAIGKNKLKAIVDATHTPINKPEFAGGMHRMANGGVVDYLKLNDGKITNAAIEDAAQRINNAPAGPIAKIGAGVIGAGEVAGGALADAGMGVVHGVNRLVYGKPTYAAAVAPATQQPATPAPVAPVAPAVAPIAKPAYAPTAAEEAMLKSVPDPVQPLPGTVVPMRNMEPASRTTQIHNSNTMAAPSAAETAWAASMPSVSAMKAGIMDQGDATYYSKENMAQREAAAGAANLAQYNTDTLAGRLGFQKALAIQRASQSAAKLGIDQQTANTAQQVAMGQLGVSKQRANTDEVTGAGHLGVEQRRIAMQESNAGSEMQTRAQMGKYHEALANEIGVKGEAAKRTQRLYTEYDAATTPEEQSRILSKINLTAKDTGKVVHFQKNYNEFGAVSGEEPVIIDVKTGQASYPGRKAEAPAAGNLVVGASIKQADGQYGSGGKTVTIKGGKVVSIQ